MSQDQSRHKFSWVPPKLWSSRAYILGGGPSLKDVDIERLRGKNVIAVNNAYRLANWIPFIYFGDRAWWEWHEDEVIHHPGIRVTACPDLKGTKRVKWMDRGERGVYDPRPGRMSYGHSSGHAAICLAVDLGATEIVLLGFDMHARNGHNWHEDHKRQVPPNIYEDNFMKPFRQLAASLEGTGVRVLNATPNSALDAFPKASLEDFLP